MATNCILHNEQECAKQANIEKLKAGNIVRIVHAFDWNSQSDNTALIQEEVGHIIDEMKNKFPSINYKYETLGGKDGSIYCDICRQIKSADIGLFDVSTHNSNVVFELGLAIGIGIYVFILRSMHSRREKSALSDLNGILEYRFSRISGNLRFKANFKRSLRTKLVKAAKRHLKRRSGKLVATQY